MSIPGGEGYGILIIVGFILALILISIAFIPSFYFVRQITANKKGKVYIKSKNARLIISICIALVIGYVSYGILSPFIMRLQFT